MENRLFFVVGDIASNVLIATLSLGISAWLLGGAPDMLSGMVFGMLIGMVLAMGVGFAMISPRLGIMEVITPCMLSGMLAGMAGGMWSFSLVGVLQWGPAIGISVLAVIYGMNAALTGPQQLDKQPDN